MIESNTIAETNNFIILDKYESIRQPDGPYQSESDLERELIRDLQAQGYEYAKNIDTPAKLLANVRDKLEALNNMHFSDVEWVRFTEEWLDKANDGIIEKTRKIHDDYIYDFRFDDGHIQNIYLLDKKNVARNTVQVINQLEQTGTQINRYDVTILINGLPLVQIELKRRGINIREAFNQIHRYSKESFNSDHSLFKYLQIFVISNGTESRYFANTTKRDKNSFDFTMNWAKSDNVPLKDLKDFTATFFQKNTLLKVLLHYSIFDVNNTLLIMRPYQIAAVERILQKIKAGTNAGKYCTTEYGGYIWHTTGSGKTMTSFKAARLAAEMPCIDKVLFVVDRKDLDYQTMREYQRFSPDSVNGSENAEKLKENLNKDDNRIVVTTLQKLNKLMSGEPNLPVYAKRVVFIFDECHRSQFGEAQKKIKKRFKKYYQFGFTGTPIFYENSINAETTAHVFGQELHSYVITDAIRDEKVLKFKVDYNDVRPKFKAIETERDEKKLTAAEMNDAFLQDERVKAITQYILNNFRQKTHRLQPGFAGFNAMFAVSSVKAAKMYYEAFKKEQECVDKPLKVATIFSYAPNQEQNAVGDISDERTDTDGLKGSDKEFLAKVIQEYNAAFKMNYGVDGKGFQNYYKDIAKRVRSGEIDLLIVVGMFLTGFDAPRLNTLFVDKNLRYHGLIQAYSRTNRILDATKTFGNIVAFRDLDKATEDAIKLFGKSSTREAVTERSFRDYIDGFIDENGKTVRGFKDVVNELRERFSDPGNIDKEESVQKDFAKLFGEYLRLENKLQNYDEFTALTALQKIDANNTAAMEAFKVAYHVSDDSAAELQKIPLPSERAVQDYRSVYNDILEWRHREAESNRQEASVIDWNDVVFEIELLKSQEINLEYILELIFKHHKQTKDKVSVREEIRRVVRSSAENRAKESLIVKFVDTTDLDEFEDTDSVIEAFFTFAREEQRREAAELIEQEDLTPDAAKRYIELSLKRGYADDKGMDLTNTLNMPKTNRLDPKFRQKKKSVWDRIVEFIKKFKGIGGKL